MGNRFTWKEIDAQADRVLGGHHFFIVDAGIVQLYLSYSAKDQDKLIRSLPESMVDHLYIELNKYLVAEQAVAHAH